MSFSSYFFPAWSVIGENSLKTRSAPPSTNCRKESSCDSTRLGNFTSGSRKRPKNFCGRTAVCVFAIGEIFRKQNPQALFAFYFLLLSSIKRLQTGTLYFFAKKRVRNSISSQANIGRVYTVTFPCQIDFVPPVDYSDYSDSFSPDSGGLTSGDFSLLASFASFSTR